MFPERTVDVTIPDFRINKTYKPTSLVKGLSIISDKDYDNEINILNMKIKAFTRVINSVPKYGNPLFCQVDNFHHNEPVPRKWSWENTPIFVQERIVHGLRLELDLAILQKQKLQRIVAAHKSSLTVEERVDLELSCDEQLKKIQRVLCAMEKLNHQFHNMCFEVDFMLWKKIE
jgi:hypothetical protein